MSLAAAIRTFAEQAARERAEVFSGPVNAAGCNLQIGQRQFRAAFTELVTAIEATMHGKRVLCSASVLIPASLNLAIDVDTVVTHLPTGAVYEVAQYRPHPTAVVTSVLLRRREP